VTAGSPSLGWTAGLWFHRAVTDLAAAHDELRPLMFSVAYRMLGSVAEAEDVVQDAFLRMHRSMRNGCRPESPEAYATTVATRLAIDTLRSARHRRETYVGPWLPEPLVESDADDPARRIEMDETVSLAFLVVLERLSPVERAVFLLRDVFGYAYGDIARVVGKSETNCRQQLLRARRHIDAARPRFEAHSEEHRALTERFLTAVREGDVDGLERLLADDVVFYGDGGGKAPAIQEPLRGVTKVARFVAGLARRGEPLGVGMEPALANGQPALRLLGPDGVLLGILGLEIAGGHVVALRNQINPDKLAHLGQVGDLNALMAEGSRKTLSGR
jgi:RNA polymerase sigma-70 factor (TIGR02957 family)